tara:strand:+ start:351 stop:899 length:549 start_codon:yes stop_codon:yes gene_type:complete
MRIILISIFLIILSSCSKPKAILICGNHICINNDEAEQYFEENLSIEVKIINKKDTNNIDLVELNLLRNSQDQRVINVKKSPKENNNIKKLSSKEIKKIKSQIKEKKFAKKKIDKTNNSPIIKETNKKIDIKNNNSKKKIKKVNKDIVDICKLIDKCSIEEISKYLIQKGNRKNFPDITIRQ